MKNLCIGLLVLIQCFCMASCYKDKGNYTYKDINTVTIANIDTVSGYAVFFGDTLTITPSVSGSLVPAGSQPDYAYQWSFYDEINGDRVISTDKDLKVRVSELPGSYSLQYRVTDNGTGVVFHTRTTLLVRTAVYEGYLVLSDVNGKSRLDMLSYDATKDEFTQINDVLQRMNSSLPPQGQPYEVVCTRVSNAFNFSDSTYGIYILSETGTNRIHPETFDWNPTYNIRYEIAGTLDQEFKATNIFADPATYFISIGMAANNNIYVRTGGVPLYNQPVNRYPGHDPFKASSQMAMLSANTGPLVMYNMDAHSFAMLPSLYGSTVVDVPTATAPGEFNFPTGGDLLYMNKNSAGYAYAITKTPGTNNCYLTKFIPGEVPVYSKLIKGVDIEKATQFAVSAAPEYLFYSVGGKVYEYDLYLESSKLMIDKESSVINYLAFQKFSSSRSSTIYGQWSRWLTVGYTDVAAAPVGNGTLEQYAVPDANEALIQKSKWTGFGNIVSVSYRER